MRFLIVGDAGSIFIKQYIEYVLLGNSKHQIVLLCEYDGINDDYLRFYSENGVVIENLWISNNNWLKKIPKIRSSLGVKLWCNYIEKKYGNFDFIHIHGLNYSRGNIGLFLRGITNKLVISVWGDELFRADNEKLVYYRRYYDISDIITLSTGDMYKKFSQVYGDLYQERIRMNKFAIGLFDYIEEYKNRYTRTELNEYFGIKNTDKINVFVGFNGRSSQRHFEIIDSIKNLPQCYIKKVNLILTMTYGVPNAQYLLDLEKKLQEMGCSYVILSSFLNESDMAKLRCICDILLHAQLTDAFSASIQESLYGGSIVFTGDWLPYSELPNWQDFFVVYSSFEELCSKLEHVLGDFERFRSLYSKNKEYMYNMSSRKTTTNAWRESLSL